MGRNIFEVLCTIPNYEVYGAGLSRSVGGPSPGDNTIPGPRFLCADLTSKAGVEKIFQDQEFDIVIQAAATTSGSKDIIERPYLHVTDNAVMNSLLLQACYDYNVSHFLFLSCGVMYNPDRSPVTEEDFFLDEGIFENYFGVGWTKVYVEKMSEFFSKLGRTRHTVIRHSNTYGPYDKYDLDKSHMFGATIAKVMSAKEGDEITVWGDGSTERDLLYVDDVVEFVKLAISKQEAPYKLYNAGAGESFSVSEVVNKIIKHSGKSLSLTHDLSKPSINTKLSLISSKAEKELGWRPHTSLDDGIKKTIKWYAANNP